MKTGCSFHSWSVIYSYLYTRYYYLFICIYNMKYWLWWWRKFYWVKVVIIQYKNTPLQVKRLHFKFVKIQKNVLKVSKLKVLMQNSTSVIFMICMLQEYYYWSINLESAFLILSTWRILLKLYMLLGSLNIAMHHIL